MMPCTTPHSPNPKTGCTVDHAPNVCDCENISQTLKAARTCEIKLKYFRWSSHEITDILFQFYFMLCESLKSLIAECSHSELLYFAQVLMLVFTGLL